MTIFTFSGTGNSLAAAIRLSDALGTSESVQLEHVCRIESPVSVTPHGAVGLVFPVHMNALPKPIRRFLEEIDLSETTYLFAVATHGGVPGNVGGYINRLLRRRAKSRGSEAVLLDAFFPIEMVNNTPKGVAPRPLMRMNWADDITPEKVAVSVASLERSIPEIAAVIRERRTPFRRRYEEDRRARGTPAQRALWNLDRMSPPTLDFILDTDACTGCAICEELCPSRRIVMTHGAPSWPREAECYYCYGCFNYCPEEAIGVKHYTRKDGRYHFPGITPQMIAAQHL